MDSRHAIHTVESAEKLGLGERAYQIVSLDQVKRPLPLLRPTMLDSMYERGKNHVWIQ
jgi:hypothetical protein